MLFRSRNRLRFEFRRPEELESRALMHGHALGVFAVHAGMGPAIFARALAGSETHSETHLSAALVASDTSGATGKVNYELETHGSTTSTKFSVSVTGAPASSTLNVAIDGAKIGTLSTDASGNGILSLSSKAGTLPNDFPTSLAAGANVTVGDTLGGKLATSTDDGEGDCHGVDVSVTRIGGRLSDPNDTSVSGWSVYKTRTVDGTTTTVFKASIRGAAANTTFDVSVDGTVVGQLTTDANGRGSLVMSTNPTGSQLPLDPATFPAVTPGTTQVKIGDTLVGTIDTLPARGRHRH